MLLDDRMGVCGCEVAVINPIAGEFFLDFGLEAIAQGFGEPGPVEQSCPLCGLEYHGDGSRRAMIEAAGGFELDLLVACLGDRAFKCGIHRFAATIATTAAIGIGGRSAFGADKNAVLAG